MKHKRIYSTKLYLSPKNVLRATYQIVGFYGQLGPRGYFQIMCAFIFYTSDIILATFNASEFQSCRLIAATESEKRNLPFVCHLKQCLVIFKADILAIESIM